MTLTRADFESIAGPLCGAGEDGRARLLEASLLPAVRLAIRAFLTEQAGVLEGEHRPLGAALEEVAGGPLTVDEALALPVSHLRPGLLPESGVDPLWGAASVAAQASALGRPAPWRARLSVPRRLRFGGVASPAARRIEVAPALGALDVELEAPALGETRSRLVLSEIALGGESDAGAGWDRQVAVPVARTSLWIVPPAFPGLLGAGVEPDFSEQPLGMIAETVARGVDVLRTFAPEYVPWVDRVVRAIVPLRCPPETSISRSVKGEHGIVYASFPADALHMAEVLVHEAAHQYFNILEHAVWLASPLADARLYWSPYIQKERTIDRILFAYHAFANVLVFHRRCREGRLDPRLAVHNDLASQERQLAILDGHLRPATTGLRPAGRALYDALALRVGRLDRAS